MGEVTEEDIAKYKGLVPLVYDIKAMSLVKARSEEMQCAVYLKREADKVIRRLKAKLTRKGISNRQLETDKNHNWSKYCHAMTEIRHHKYKRCMDKVKQCTSMMIFNSKYGTDKKWHFFKKWRERWLGLAEKFK